MLRIFVISFLTLFIAFQAPAYAAESFDLIYQKQNRWVATEDAKGLRDLLKTAKSAQKTNFLVSLPTDDRTITIERLVVLRDILEKQLKQAVTIEEIEETAQKNHISVTFKK